jgi:hypothetical protein
MGEAKERAKLGIVPDETARRRAVEELPFETYARKPREVRAHQMEEDTLIGKVRLRKGDYVVLWEGQLMPFDRETFEMEYARKKETSDDRQDEEGVWRIAKLRGDAL